VKGFPETIRRLRVHRIGQWRHPDTDILRSADLALYHSKNAGRGVCHFFDSDMRSRAEDRRALEFDLRKALVLRQMELHYQPQIDVESRSIIGLEGLLRWRHPKRGLLLPADFLPLAEEIGLLLPIGEWVLKTACKEASTWPNKIAIAVNVSALQFESPAFIASVEMALLKAGLDGSRLEVEVTENILIRSTEIARSKLELLRKMGVHITMDSFGTWLASLSHLVQFPFNKIKIDRTLVSDVPFDSKSRAILRAVSALGQSLGIATLAAGVETREHLSRVQQEGCQSVQGFFYSAAVPAKGLDGMQISGGIVNESLCRILYCSKNLISDNENQQKEMLANILQTARRRNSEQDVTGALFYNSGYFAQVLEGPKKAI